MDTSSILVRTAVYKGLTEMIAQPLCHDRLMKVLPVMIDRAVYDTSDKVCLSLCLSVCLSVCLSTILFSTLLRAETCFVSLY